MSSGLDSVRKRLTDNVIGSEDSAFLMIVGLLSDGHILIQGAPGIGKTTLAETLAKSINGQFSRVQFTQIYYLRISWDILFIIKVRRLSLIHI